MTDVHTIDQEPEPEEEDTSIIRERRGVEIRPYQYEPGRVTQVLYALCHWNIDPNLRAGILIFSQITEYVAIDPGVSVCVSVCVSVRVSVSSLQPKRVDRFWWNFTQITTHLLNTFFSDFEHSHLMTSWRPLLLLSVPALSRSQFCSDFLQILGRVSKSQPTVCYSKSAKSVDNFESYG